MTNLFPGTYTLTVTDNSSCTRTDTVTLTVTALNNCCTPLASVEYLLDNVALKQVGYASTQGIVNTLPYTGIPGGYRVDNVTIYISGTLTVDTDFVIANSPHIFMAPNARIVVTNGHTLTLQGTTDTTTLQAGCDSMWQGIELQPQASIVMNLAMIRDADSAVYAHGGGNISLTNAFFVQNYKGVVIDSVTSSTAYPLVMDGVHFFNRYIPLLAPLASQLRCHAGIEVNRVANIVIGDDALAQNTFQSMDTAINIVRSGVVVTNQFISGDTVGGYFTTTLGIGARDNIGQIYPVFIGNSPLGTITDTFYLCDYAIQAKNFGKSSFEVSHCYILNRLETDSSKLRQAYHMIGTAITATNFSPMEPAHPHRVDIHHNHIYEGSVGVLATYNRTGLSIHDNEVSLTPNTDCDINYGICTKNDAVSIAYPPINTQTGDSIYDNTVSAGLGIVSMLRNRQSILNNTITLTTWYTHNNDPTPGYQQSRGIVQALCLASHVSCNSVTGFQDTVDSPIYGTFGIDLTGANGSLFQCNQVNHVDIGMAANGPNILTMKNNRLGVDTCNVGFAVINNGSVGPQGTVDTAYDNEWRGYYRQYPMKTYSSLGTLSPFFVRSNGAGYFVPNSALGNPITINLIAPSYPPDSCSQSGVGCSSNIIAYLVVNHQYARSILADTIQYPLDSILYRDWSRFNLYSALQYADTSLLNDTVISNFFDAYHSSTIGQLLDRRVQMDTLDLSDYSTYSSLHSAINSISTGSDFEGNLKSYALLYLQSQHYGMNSELAGATKDLAKQCLFYGGPAILEARALLGADSLKYIGYRWQDSCVTGSGKRGKDEKPQVITNIKPQLDYKLIPNLYKDNFMAHMTLNTDELGEIQIYSVAGALMGRHKVIAGENDINLSSDGLQAGIYFYKVYVNGELKTNDKLVVVH